MTLSTLPSARPETDASITAWALSARDGDPVAVDRWVRALYRDVLRYVLHLSADPQGADDLVQDTFVRALAGLHRFEGRSSSRAWLLTIARRAVVDSHRRAAVRPRLCDSDAWEAVAVPGFEDGVVLLDLLATLPRERREAFVLTQIAGRSYEEVAALSGCPVGTVRSRVARARATLAASLAEHPADAVA